MYSGVSRYDSFLRMLISLAVIVIGLIMFGSVSLIYNAFSISVSERTRQFGLLSSVGATKKQLKKMVLFEAFVVSIVGIPLGIAAGIGGIGVTLLLIGNKFISIMGDFDLPLRVCVSWQAVVIGYGFDFRLASFEAGYEDFRGGGHPPKHRYKGQQQAGQNLRSEAEAVWTARRPCE